MNSQDIKDALVEKFRAWLEDPKGPYVFKAERMVAPNPQTGQPSTHVILSGEVGLARAVFEAPEAPRIVTASGPLPPVPPNGKIH